jgi:uncharacterized protein YabE (DUF348 family)
MKMWTCICTEKEEIEAEDDTTKRFDKASDENEAQLMNGMEAGVKVTCESGLNSSGEVGRP